MIQTSSVSCLARETYLRLPFNITQNLHLIRRAAKHHKIGKTRLMERRVFPIILLLKRGASTTVMNKDGYDAIGSAASNNRTEILECLKEEGNVDINRILDNKTHLMVASANGECDVIQCLLEAGADVNLKNSQEESALSFALLEKQMEAAKLLIQNDCDIEATSDVDVNPLILLTKQGQTRTMKELIAHRVSLSSQIATLSQAISQDPSEAARTLIRNNCKIEAKRTEGVSPLILAASMERKLIVKALIDHGVFLEVQTQSGTTALSEAAIKGHTEVVRMFVNGGAHIDHEDADGFTPLFWAAYGKHKDTVRLLVNKGADIRNAIQISKTCSLNNKRAARRVLEAMSTHKRTLALFGARIPTFKKIHWN